MRGQSREVCARAALAPPPHPTRRKAENSGGGGRLRVSLRGWRGCCRPPPRAPRGAAGGGSRAASEGAACGLAPLAAGCQGERAAACLIQSCCSGQEGLCKAQQLLLEPLHVCRSAWWGEGRGRAGRRRSTTAGRGVGTRARVGAPARCQRAVPVLRRRCLLRQDHHHAHCHSLTVVFDLEDAGVKEVVPGLRAHALSGLYERSAQLVALGWGQVEAGEVEGRARQAASAVPCHQGGGGLSIAGAWAPGAQPHPTPCP